MPVETRNKKRRYTPNTKERIKEHMSVIYDMFEVPRPTPIQQNRTSKQKGTLTGALEINPKRQKYDVQQT